MDPRTSRLMGTERKCRFFITANLKPHRCERGEMIHLIHMTHILSEEFGVPAPIEITWRVDPPYIVE